MKFEVDEIAVYVFAPTGAHFARNPHFPVPDGALVRIVAVGPFPPGTLTQDCQRATTHPVDYEIEYAGEFWHCREQSLRKRRPPERLGSWDAIAEYTKWSPRRVEESV